MLHSSKIAAKALAAVAVLACTWPVGGAEAEREKASSYVGMTRDQVYARLGDPQNLMKAGAREVMFFAKVKLTLRNNIVVETEDIFDEIASRRPHVEAAASAAVPPVAEAPGPETADAAKARKSGGATSTSGVAEASATPSKPGGSESAAPTPAVPVAAGLEIKSVRGPGRPLPKVATKPSTVTPRASAPVAAVVVPVPVAPKPTPAAVKPEVPEVGQVSTSAGKPAAVAPEKLPEKNAPMAVAESETTAEVVTELPVVEKPKPPRRRAVWSSQSTPEQEFSIGSLFTTRTYLFGAAVVGAIGYLLWRRRQHGLDLAATTVSSTPFEEPLVKDDAALFDAALLAKLEWKRFEELVAAYYVKTGVVAVRTKSGPESAVHLKISWKGETKPFAGVHCVANPTGLIRSEPLVKLFEALDAAEIRRGYIVTNGKFNVEARDYASEKHFTLLSGDLFLEKLNALPPAARTELMHQITTGDYTTPTCPKCDAKMVRFDETSWRCANHPRCEATIPPRNR